METNTEELLVGQLAGRDYRNAEVFRKYGIDFCCGGGRTIAQAAKEAGISEGELRSALQNAELSQKKNGPDPAKLTVEELMDNIVKVHHHYCLHAAPALIEYARKVSGHHGGLHPELRILEEQVRHEMNDLLLHLKKEENVLFPAILQLWKLSQEEGQQPGSHRLHFIHQAIDNMLKDHQHSGEHLEIFRKLTDNYTAPAGACNSYLFLYDKLREFDNDLQEHIHKENNILFPKTLALLESVAGPQKCAL